MTNDQLRTGCPVCSGTGLVGYLRSGEWLNSHCPGKNGPVDNDGSPMTHELDNRDAKRFAVIEYKRPSESMSRGQERHFDAILDSTRGDWQKLLVLVIDDGQTMPAESVSFQWRVTGRSSWADQRSATVGELGQRIANWLWPDSVPLALANEVAA